MGNTCASVHIALTGAAEAIDGIVQAYSTLGFERVKAAPPEGAKHVIVLHKDGDSFFSVYDSDNAALDSGELKDLALAAAATTTSAFADDALAELSRLIGLTAGQSQLHYQDLRDDDALAQHLHFTRSSSAPRAAPQGQISLRNYFDPDNSRMVLVYPASWPVPLSHETRVT